MTTTRPAATEEDLLRTPDKVGEYLQAGVRMVWVIDPGGTAAAVYRSLTDVRSLGPNDFLDGEEVVPGFRCRLAEILGAS